MTSSASSQSFRRPSAFADGGEDPPLRFIGLLTRAEEVGFIGAIAHFDLGWLTRAGRPIICVNLENFRTSRGADRPKRSRWLNIDPIAVRGKQRCFRAPLKNLGKNH